jgi:uncharacterized protein YciI
VSWFVVLREPGPAWDAARGMRDQERWDDHAAFMDRLAEEGFVVLGGPLGDGSKFMHVVDAAGVDEVRARLAADPWEPMELLRTTQVEPWEILLGKSSQRA